MSKTTMVSCTCLQCGAKFKVTEGQFRSRPTVKYCGRRCAGLAARKPGRMVEITCAGCGKKRMKRADHIPLSTNHYCSKPCADRGLLGVPRSKKTPGYWKENGYRVVSVLSRPVKEHRLIMERHLGRKL